MELNKFFPEHIYADISIDEQKKLEEIRVREGQRVEFVPIGKVSQKKLDKADVEEILNYLTDYSISTYENQMKEGFFTIEGGHRIGVAGRIAANGMMEINSINIRISHEKKGCSEKLIEYIDTAQGLHNTLIISGPGIGKTTYLRDCVRILSQKYKIGIVDERSEIGAACMGQIQNDLGPKSDVMDSCKKATGMKMLLRSMSPQIIAVDEIGDKEDYLAIEEMMNSGVHFIGSVHARDIYQIMQKVYVWKLVQNRIIERMIFLKINEMGDRCFSVIDEDGRLIC